MQEQTQHRGLHTVLAVGILAGAVACSSTPGPYETRYSGSYTDDTATRSSKTAACNNQVRLRNWSAFGTGYTTKTVSNTPNSITGQTEIRTRYGNVGQFFFGYDPDPSTDYRSSDVLRRWGGDAGLAMSYLGTAKNIPDGTDGFNLTIADIDGERRSALDINIFHSGLYPMFKERGHLGFKTQEDKVRVIYQFENAKPFPETHSMISPQPTFSDNGSLSISYGTTSYLAGEWVEQHRADLLAYLLTDRQPSSLLNISLLEPDGQVLYVAQLDMRDARDVFSQAYANYVGIIDRGCATS